nr:hypothetical protein [Microbacterium testaceum]
MSSPTPGVLSAIDFGRFDAEQDANLLDYFIDVGTASDALLGKYLVIGRKGSGKTALFKHVAASATGTVVEMDLEDYVFQAHKRLIDQAVSPAFAYAASWRFAIAISMYVEASPTMGWRLRWRGRRILRQIGAGPNKGPLAALFGWLGRVRKVALPSIPGIAELGGFEIADVEETFLVKSTLTLLDQLEEVLAAHVKKTPVTALVDRLDDAWDGTEESLRLIGGAVRAARHFAGKLQQDGPAPVIVFLRTDLWEKIAFNDKNKFAQDAVYLDWPNEELERVIDRRIHKTAGVPEGEGWATVFTTERMRSGTTALKYMTKRVLGRPRDIVAFSTFALDVAVSNGHTTIDGQDIYDAEVRYSKHIVDELRDELGDHVPSMVAVVNALKALGRRTFTLSTWKTAAMSAGIEAENVDAVLEQLFEASVVGVLRTGGGGGGSRTVYRYQDRFLRATETGQLQVHPAFTKELGLTDA